MDRHWVVTCSEEKHFMEPTMLKISRTGKTRTLVWLLTFFFLTTALSSCDWPWSKRYWIGLVPPYTDSYNPLHGPHEFLYNSFWETIRSLRRSDVRIRTPFQLFDKRTSLNPGIIFRPNVREFYLGFARDKVRFLERLARYNHVDIIFWCTYVADDNLQEYRITLNGFRVRDNLYLSTSYTLLYGMDRQEMIEVSKENFSIVASRILAG